MLAGFQAETTFSRHLFTWKGEYNAAKAWFYLTSIHFSAWLLNTAFPWRSNEMFAGMMEVFHDHTLAAFVLGVLRHT